MKTGTMATSNPTGTSVQSAQTNVRLPVACSDANNSSSVDQPRRPGNVTSASCSPWQSGIGQGVLRNERGAAETAVKASCVLGSGFDFRSDAAAVPVPHSRNREMQMPCYVSRGDVGNGAEGLIDLRSDDWPIGDSHQHMSGSRLSRDGLTDTTVADASPDQTSSQPGLVSALHSITRHVRKMRICDCRIFGTLPHFSLILAK